MAGPTVRWGAAVGFGAVWWWAVLRLVLSRDAGVLEGAVAAGGWGLSLLPVHCVPKSGAAGASAFGRRLRAGHPDESDDDVRGGASEGAACEVGSSDEDASGGAPGGGSSGGDAAVASGEGPPDGSGGSSVGASGGWPFGARGGAPLVHGDGWPFGITKASPRRRSDGGSGPS
jgi:hypothetical protein